MLTTDEKLDAANNMITYGGSFMQALGKALLRADTINTEKIYSMWKEDIDMYLNWNKK